MEQSLENMIKGDAGVYAFTMEQPKTLEDVMRLDDALSFDQTPPVAASLYKTSRLMHKEDTITKERLALYADYYTQQEIDNAIFFLVDLGYLKVVDDENQIKELKDKEKLNFKYVYSSRSKCHKTFDSNIIRIDASPIAVGVYIACIENNTNGFITFEDIMLSACWNCQYIDRGIEELENLGYLKKTNWYSAIDGREEDYYAFRKSLNRNFPDADNYFSKKDNKK